jgi:starch synthase (maltosyl-transferring)
MMKVVEKSSVPFVWQWPDDLSRLMPVPGGTSLLIQSNERLTVQWRDHSIALRESAEAPPRWQTALSLPEVKTLQMEWLIFFQNGREIGRDGFLLLPEPTDMQAHFDDKDGFVPRLAILANRAGHMTQVRRAWGEIESQYDSWLSYNPDDHSPTDRRHALTRMSLWLHIGAERYRIGADTVRHFAQPSPNALLWECHLHGMAWRATLTLGPDRSVALHLHALTPAAEDVWLELRPDLEDRSSHAVTAAWTGPEWRLREGTQCDDEGRLRVAFDDGWFFHLSATTPATLDPQWTYQVPLPHEASRGLATATDLYSPGWWAWTPARHTDYIWQAQVTREEAFSQPSVAPFIDEKPRAAPIGQDMISVMRSAMALFLVRREPALTVMAGYPWFLDWGRDSLIFARGLLAEGQTETVRAILSRFGAWEKDGSLPNALRGHDASDRETADAPLWFVLVLAEWAERDPSAISHPAGERTLGEIALSIVTAHLTETAHGVRLDQASGLLWCPAHFTWMDTARPCGTPCEGYPLLIQALWWRALCWAGTQSTAEALTFSQLADQVAESVSRLYWLDDQKIWSDTLHGPRGTTAAEATPDDHLRPNQLLAANLGIFYSVTEVQRQAILSAGQALIVPGALRSLARRRVTVPLPVVHEDQPLHDPLFPYHGRYRGPEDTERKPAYHNGTAWAWLLPSYAEIIARWGDTEAPPMARKLLSSSAWLWHDGCLGQLPEIIDGDAPHSARGCPAQAWSVSEWLRVWHFLTGKKPPSS